MILNGIYVSDKSEVESGDWYSYRDIDATNANYRVVIGQKSNGKTYGFKLKVLENFFKNKKQFAYLRTTAEEIKTKRVDYYWEDLVDVIDEYARFYFSGYDHYAVKAFKGSWKLYGYPTEKEASKEDLGTIGFYFSLVQSKYDSSVPYPKVNIICYEEFLNCQSQDPELFASFTKFISTIKRKRTDMIVYLLGNTVSRNNIILHEMNINPRNLVQGEVQLFEFFNEREGKTIRNSVAVEWCRMSRQSSESESFFCFGSPKEAMIVNGAWESNRYNKFNKEKFRERFESELNVIMDMNGIRLYCYFYKDKMYVSDERLQTFGEYITFTNEGTKPERNAFDFHSDIRSVNVIKQIISSFYLNQHIVYSSDLVGDDFITVLRYGFRKLAVR